MSIKYKINEKYKNSFEEFTLNIQSYFKQNTQTIHKARNILKIVEHENIDTVVKAFRVPNIVNQFAYAYIRGSKAKKSYENAMKLTTLHINTPEPISYIEFYDNTLLQESFFIALHQPYDFLIREPLYDANFKDRENIIRQFTKFTYELHQKDIFHKDYSAGNTLVMDKGSGVYEFSIVDINRMEFKTIDIDIAMQNFNKLWADEQTLTIIADEYSKLSAYDEKECLELIIKYDKELKEFVEKRRNFKALFKGKK